mmetsp:Transcript_17782/g.41737  ORF Transcript_17782/g.41737 Transcript_17782/m.41737 type:complete len:203 (+) Transcript_17782:141-749(+)
MLGDKPSHNGGVNVWVRRECIVLLLLPLLLLQWLLLEGKQTCSLTPAVGTETQLLFRKVPKTGLAWKAFVPRAAPKELELQLNGITCLKGHLEGENQVATGGFDPVVLYPYTQLSQVSPCHCRRPSRGDLVQALLKINLTVVKLTDSGAVRSHEFKAKLQLPRCRHQGFEGLCLLTRLKRHCKAPRQARDNAKASKQKQGPK